MADKIRQIAQRLKDKVHLPQINTQSRDKVDQLITKYVPAAKVSELADKFKQETVTRKVKELITRYEKFTGVEEIMAIQNTVIDAQEKFMTAQDRRRELGREVAIIEARLKELHAEMQKTMKGDEKYLDLCTEEHKLIIQERALRALFAESEKEERELFATMSAAVKLGHERERAHAERNKYWYIVASIFGTVLGIAGSTINNRLKMAEFRDMLEQQTARSAGVLYSMTGGGVAGTDVVQAVRTELAHQESLAQNLQLMQQQIEHLVNKQSSLIDHINHREHYIEVQLKDLRRIVVAASQTSAKSDAELAKAMSAVHHDFDEDNRHRDERININLHEDETSKLALEPNHIITGLGIVVAIAIIFGNVLGRS